MSRRRRVKQAQCTARGPFGWLFVLLAAAAGGVAHADIYSFVDADGVTHFSNVPVDARYHLLLATPAEARAERRPGKWLAKSALYDPMIERAARSASRCARNWCGR